MATSTRKRASGAKRPGISRIDQESTRTHGFFARFGYARDKSGTWRPKHRAFFGDASHGSKKKALAAAEAWLGQDRARGEDAAARSRPRRKPRRRSSDVPLAVPAAPPTSGGAGDWMSPNPASLSGPPPPSAPRRGSRARRSGTSATAPCRTPPLSSASSTSSIEVLPHLDRSIQVRAVEVGPAA